MKKVIAEIDFYFEKDCYEECFKKSEELGYDFLDDLYERFPYPLHGCTAVDYDESDAIMYLLNEEIELPDELAEKIETLEPADFQIAGSYELRCGHEVRYAIMQSPYTKKESGKG